jgi:hypothetical protein
MDAAALSRKSTLGSQESGSVPLEEKTLMQGFK